MEAQEELLEMERKFEALQSSVLAAHLRHPRPVPPRKIKSESPSHSGSSVIHMDGARASGYVQGDGKESSIGIASDSLRCLQDAYYLMILRMLGFGRNNEKTSSNLTPRSSETTSTCSGFASDVDIRNLRITQKSEGIMRGSRELLIAMLQKCSLLIRGMRAIKSRALEDTGEALPLPVFAFDDLTFSGHDMVTRITTMREPTRLADPIYLLPKAMINLLILDLSGCSGLAQLPASLSTLHNLVALNPSCCYSLYTLPMSLGALQNLQILLLSCCHKLKNLPVSLGKLTMLRLFDLSGCSSLEVLPDSFVNLRDAEPI